MHNESTNDRGFIILSATIILGAVGTAIGLSLAYLAVNSSQNSTVSQQSSQARYLADACAEVALDEIRIDAGYDGNVSVTVGDSTCLIDPVTVNGSEYTIPVSATIDTIVRRARVVANRTVTPDPLDPMAPGTVAVTINSWQEVVDF